jgi:tRNA G18 (ribose-2'-O)-methylase SpoU
MLTRLTDPSDPRLDWFRRPDRQLSDRIERRDDRGAGLFVAEGDLVVSRALAARCRPVSALADDDVDPSLLATLAETSEVLVADEDLRRAVTGFGVVHRIIALFERPPRPDPVQLVAATGRLVVAEAVDNPVNIGSVVRNAAALGWDSLLLDHTSADPLARRALRVAMGTTFALPHARTTDLVGVLGSAVADGLVLVALTPDPEASDLRLIAAELAQTPRLGILIGAERSGLSGALLDLASYQAQIPMHSGVDSLNAAAAAAIACYALAR